MAKRQSTDKEIPEAPTGIQWRGNKNAVTHHFKCEVANATKNRSWQYGVLKLDKDVAHSHYFHSINSRFKNQKYTETTGGHFHEITWSVDDKGNPKAVCGPAMEIKHKKTNTGMKKQVVRVSWYNSDTDDKYYDDHTHDVTYLDSEMLTEAGVKKTVQENRAKIAAIAGPIGFTQTSPEQVDGFEEA